MVRALVYWSVWTVIAVGATAVSVHGSDGQTLTGSLSAGMGMMMVPDPARAVVLGVGIMAMAFTYRQAWESWRRK